MKYKDRGWIGLISLHTRSLIVVDVDALELKVGGAFVLARGVDAVLLRDHLPELEQTNMTG